MKKYPVLLFIPHGGIIVLDELIDRMAINSSSILWDSDPYSLEIYRLEKQVIEIVETDIFRTFIDLNRILDRQGLESLELVVKTRTFLGEVIYKIGL